MKSARISAILILLATQILSAQEPDRNASMAGIDFGAALKNKCLKITGSHQMAKKWTAGGYATIRFHGRKQHEEEALHESEFAETEDLSSQSSVPDHMTTSVFVQFWPEHAYEGIFISTGCRMTDRRKADCTLGIGYFMTIWRSLSAAIHIETEVLDSWNTQTFKGEGIGICLCIRF